MANPRAWDAFTTLGVFPDSDVLESCAGKKDFTCLGTARSTKQRCGIRIGKDSRNRGAYILENLGCNVDPRTTETLREHLRELSSLLLCRHCCPNQASACLSNWQRRICQNPVLSASAVPTRCPRPSLLTNMTAKWDPYHTLGIYPDAQFHCLRLTTCTKQINKDDREKACRLLNNLSQQHWDTPEVFDCLEEVAWLAICKSNGHRKASNVQDLCRTWELKLQVDSIVYAGHAPRALNRQPTAPHFLSEASVPVTSMTPVRSTTTTIVHGLATPPPSGASELQLDPVTEYETVQSAQSPLRRNTASMTPAPRNFNFGLPSPPRTDPFEAQESTQRTESPLPESIQLDLTPPLSQSSHENNDTDPETGITRDSAAASVQCEGRFDFELPSPPTDNPFTRPQAIEALAAEVSPPFTLRLPEQPALQTLETSEHSISRERDQSLIRELKAASRNVSTETLPLARQSVPSPPVRPETPTPQPRIREPPVEDFGHVTITSNTYVYGRQARRLSSGIVPVDRVAVRPVIEHEPLVSPGSAEGASVCVEASIESQQNVCASGVQEQPILKPAKPKWYRRLFKRLCFG